MNNNSEQQYCLLKGMRYPNFTRTTTALTDAVADAELAMMETDRLASADAFVSEATGLISWKDVYTFCKDIISAKERQYGAAAATAANGMAVG